MQAVSLPTTPTPSSPWESFWPSFWSNAASGLFLIIITAYTINEIIESKNKIKETIKEIEDARLKYTSTLQYWAHHNDERHSAAKEHRDEAVINPNALPPTRYEKHLDKANDLLFEHRLAQKILLNHFTALELAIEPIAFGMQLGPTPKNFLTSLNKPNKTIDEKIKKLQEEQGKVFGHLKPIKTLASFIKNQKTKFKTKATDTINYPTNQK